MSIQPAWCFFKIPVRDTPEVKARFDEAIELSEIESKAHDFERRRREKRKSEEKGIPMSSEENLDKSNLLARNLDEFGAEDIDATLDLFFSSALEDLVEAIADIHELPLSVMPSETIIDFLTADRIGASQMLFSGLGWEKANKLPGFFGNIFVDSFEVSNILVEVEMIFASVNYKRYLKKAKLLGARGNLNDYSAALAFEILPSALGVAEREECSLLALNFSHSGGLPL